MQKVVRTSAKNENCIARTENEDLAKMLNDGYCVVMCNKIGSELEYIVEKSTSNK